MYLLNMRHEAGTLFFFQCKIDKCLVYGFMKSYCYFENMVHASGNDKKCGKLLNLRIFLME